MSKMMARDMKLLMDFTRGLGFTRFKDETELNERYGEAARNMFIEKDDFPCYIDDAKAERIIAEKDIINFLTIWNE